jgi:hypothetical protein
MATISGTTLSIVGLNATTVSATVKYTLTPSAIEKLAGTVFSESIRLVGDDPGILSDITVANLPAQVFAVSSATVNVARTRTINLLKSALNEDPGFASTGAELSDEILGSVKISYAANAPTTPTLPPVATSNVVSGAWK